MSGTSNFISTHRVRIRVAAVAATVLGTALALSGTTHASANLDVPVVICRATQNQAMPYIQEEVRAMDLIGLVGSPNVVQNYPIWNSLSSFWGDIVPPIAGWLPDGQNWTDGASVWGNNCAVPQSAVVPPTAPPTTSVDPGVTNPGGTEPGVLVETPVYSSGTRVLPSTGKSSTLPLLLALGMTGSGSLLTYLTRRPRRTNTQH